MEQISEELRTLDEMLAGSVGRELAETLAPQETLAPPEEQDPTEVDGQGTPAVCFKCTAFH